MKIVDFETSKLAKQLNFNELVHNVYCYYTESNTDPEYPNGGGAFSFQEHEVELVNRVYSNDNSRDTDYYQLYSAPTQSHLLKWLREKENFHVITQPVFNLKEIEYSNYLYYYTYYLYYLGKPINVVLTKNYFTSFEETTEHGIKNALKFLINEKKS